MKLKKETLALVVGIGLPLLLLVFFGMAAYIPRTLVAGPEHDLLFTSGGAVDVVKIFAVEGKVHVRIDPIGRKRYFKDQYYHNASLPALYRFDAVALKSQQIHYEIPRALFEKEELPPDLNEYFSKSGVPLNELSSIDVDSSLEAPDGYTFHQHTTARGGDFVFLFFGSHRRRGVIQKQARMIEIPNAQAYNAGFIGWVVSDE